MTCLAAQEAFLREHHPEIAKTMDALGMTFEEYYSRIDWPMVVLTGNSTEPLPPIHWDIRTRDWHWESQCPEGKTTCEV